MIEVQQFEVEPQAIAADHDVFGMQVAVVFLHLVDALDAEGERVQQMQSLERCQAPAGLALEETGEQLALDKLGDQQRDRHAAVGDGLPGVVLDGDRAVAQLVEFACVEIRGGVPGVALWIKQLDCPFDIRDQVDLALPAAADRFYYLILARQNAPRLYVETVDRATG